MNTPPPPDEDYRGHVVSQIRTDLNKRTPDEVARAEELARRAAGNQYPGEGGKVDTDQGKATWKQLGIEKGK